MSSADRSHVQLVSSRPVAVDFSECVRAVVAVARRHKLVVPTFRSPPKVERLDRTIVRRVGGAPIVAVRLADRPIAAVQADVIEGVIAANGLEGERADRFRRLAWRELDGPAPRTQTRATMNADTTARVA